MQGKHQKYNQPQATTWGRVKRCEKPGDPSGNQNTCLFLKGNVGFHAHVAAVFGGRAVFISEIVLDNIS